MTNKRHERQKWPPDVPGWRLVEKGKGFWIFRHRSPQRWAEIEVNQIYQNRDLYLIKGFWHTIPFSDTGRITLKPRRLEEFGAKNFARGIMIKWSKQWGIMG